MMATLTARSEPALLAPSPPTGQGPSPRSGGSSARSHSGRAKTLASQENGQQILPDLRTSDTVLNTRDPLPTTLQSDFIPQDILKALVQAPCPQEQLGPLTRNRNLNVSMMASRRPPAGVWAYPRRREKFKYLTDNTPCVCGAGKDISFLYDVPKKDSKPVQPDTTDQSSVRVQEEDQPRKAIQLPDTLIPEEYHVVKNKGVLGLEYHEDKFATQPQDHEKHLVMFPSMNPVSRFEVKQLKKTMSEMMERLGISDANAELKGPTQMHNLIEIIKKEQNIYNIVFHELIRQVSVDCVDRGELLANVRDQYSQLLNRIPRQIKGLHEEVMAQRALDRRLTEELIRFKSTIGILTSELSIVKEHDSDVTQQANQAQDDLKNALAESQKNASLLAEYHDLYELQRKRLEKQVSMLAEEKAIWSTAAYSLALKVTEEHSLNTAKRLHISEKAWAKLANHFTILLSDKDTEMITLLQGHVDQWRDLVDEFNTNMKGREDAMAATLTEIQSDIHGWINDFNKNVLTKDGQVAKGPDQDKAAKLYADMKKWEKYLNEESEKFGGDVLLGGQDGLLRIRQEVDGWTDCALKVFMRHRGEDGTNYPDHDEMLTMNELVDDLISQYYIRLTGENGVATGLILVTNGLDTWDSKLNALIMHGSNPLPDHDWVRLYQMMDEWIEALKVTMAFIGTTQKEDDRQEHKPHSRIEISEVMRMTQKWLSSATNGIDSEDAKLVEQVSTLHTEMVNWMVQMLLRLAPDKEEHSKEAKQAVLLGTTSVAQLGANAKSLFDRLNGFSKYVTLCCNGIVMDVMQQKVDAHEEDHDHEYRDLQRLKSECDDWIRTAKLLLSELTGEPFLDSSPAASGLDLVVTKPPEDGDKERTEEDEEDEEGDADEEETEDTDGPAPTAPPVETPGPTVTAAGTAGTVSPEPEVELPSAPEQTLTDAAALSEPPQEDVVQEQQLQEVQQEEEDVSPAELDKSHLEVIGCDENTRREVLAEQPEGAAPVDKRPPTTAGTPDPNRAFEAIAAIETLQTQLFSTEERAQCAEERATLAEAELKKALERIRALERKVVVTPVDSEAERSGSVASAAREKPDGEAPVKEKEKEKEKDKKDKDKSKTKDKEARSNSRTSTKSKKK